MKFSQLGRLCLVSSLMLSLAGCSGGGDGSSGTVTPSAGSDYSSSSDLTGRTRVRYERGGSAWATEFIYTGSTTLDGVRYAIGIGSHVTSALSNGVSIDSFACTSWDEIQAVNGSALGELGETYVCNWSYSSGTQNWYAISISSTGAISGRNLFISNDSSLNGIIELVAGRGDALQGEHEPDYVARSAVKSASSGLESVFEDLERAATD